MNKLSATIPETMAITGLGRSSIYKLFKEKKLTPRKVGKRTLILTDEIEQFIRSLPEAA